VLFCLSAIEYHIPNTNTLQIRPDIRIFADVLSRLIINKSGISGYQNNSSSSILAMPKVLFYCQEKSTRNNIVNILSSIRFK